MMITVVNNIKSNKFSSAGIAENKIKKIWSFRNQKAVSIIVITAQRKEIPKPNKILNIKVPV